MGSSKQLESVGQTRLDRYLESLIQLAFPGVPPVWSEDRSVWRLIVGSRGLKDLLVSLGFAHGAGSKVIPPFLLDSSEPGRVGLLQGLFDSDGSVSSFWSSEDSDNPHYRRFEVSFSTTSKVLSGQVASILVGFGVKTRTSIRIPTKGNRAVSYKVCLSSIEDIRTFRETVGFRLDRKRDMLDSFGDFAQ